MIYNEIGKGGVKLRGKSLVIYEKLYSVRFGRGDVLFNISKAKKGIMEKIVIKKYKLARRSLTGGYLVVMYIDTLNGLWNEDELVDYDTALALATWYINTINN